MRPRTFRQRLVPYLFLLPGTALFLAWTIYPLARAFQISLYDWKLMPGQVSEYVGAANYLAAFDDPIFWSSLRNTLMYALITVVVQMVLGLSAALLVNSAVRGRVFFRTVYYFPVVTSWVVVSLLFKYIFNSNRAGLMNYMLVDTLRILPDYIAWLSNARSAGIW